MRALSPVLFLIALTLSPMPITGADPPPEWHTIRADTPDGAELYRIEPGSEWVRFRLYSHQLGGMNAYQVILFNENWSIAGYYSDGIVTGRSQWGGGPDAAYAGVIDQGISNPVPPEPLGQENSALYVHAGFARGWLLVAWAELPSDRVYDVRVSLGDGTIVEHVASGHAASLTMADMDEGVRAGVPAAVRVAVADGTTLDVGSIALTTVEWRRVDTVGVGSLKYSSGAYEREVDLTRVTQDEDFVDIALKQEGTTCICFTSGLSVFSSADPVDVTIDYVGEGRNTDFGILHVWFDDYEPPIGIEYDKDTSPVVS